MGLFHDLSPFASALHLIHEMAAPMSVYDQTDFVPTTIFENMLAQGNVVQPIFEWLQVPEALATTTMTAVGGALTDHVSCIAHILPAEWEGMISALTLDGQPVSLIAKAKLRQVLLTARTIVGIVREQPTQTQATTTTASAVTPPAHEATDMMRTVSINDVIFQGCEAVRVPLMSDEDYPAGLENYRKKEGKYPAKDAKPTIEQVSAFVDLLNRKRRIYADLRHPRAARGARPHAATLFVKMPDGQQSA